MTNSVATWKSLEAHVASLGARLRHAHGEIVVWVGSRHEHVTDEALEMGDARLRDALTEIVERLKGEP